MKPVAPIRPRGQSGMMVSDLMPHFSSIVDDVCLFKAAHTDSKAHKASSLQLHTGMLSGVHPSVGSWISYVNVASALPKLCNSSDKPIAGLIKDLKRRGLLNETLVFWSGEFGRTYWSQDVTAS